MYLELFGAAGVTNVLKLIPTDKTTELTSQ